MRPVIALIVSLALAAGLGRDDVARAAGPEPVGQTPVAYLAWWEGKYPTDRKAPGRPPQTGPTFYEDPYIRAALRRMVPRPLLAILTTGWKGNWAEGPIGRAGERLITRRCRAHAYSSEYVIVHVDMVTGRVQACWTYPDPVKAKPESIRYAPGRPPRTLDPGVTCDSSGVFDEFEVK